MPASPVETAPEITTDRCASPELGEEAVITACHRILITGVEIADDNLEIATTSKGNGMNYRPSTRVTDAIKLSYGENYTGTDPVLTEAKKKAS